ncbi:MAG: DUF1570 domain-containing protein [Planctomycetes bacterium]|nr:DUF1570 domain-containing protein [Planctomycetota bacterium]
MRCMAWALVAAVVTTGNSPCPAAEPTALLELKIGTERLEGRIAAHNDDTCWLLRRDGRLASFRTDDVTDYHEIEPRFRPMSMLDLRDQLQTEFGRGFETKTTAHYVVVARRGTGERYATLFEQIYRQFHTYFTVRGFRIAEPEFPMVAVVLPDQQSFVDYCIGEGAKPQPNLVGFYLPSSNRVALYDRAAVGQSRASDVDDTVIHEATHQVAFNTGVHSRIGQSPLWLVEGLATLFEAEGIRHRATVAAIGDRINPERLDGFADYRKRRPANSLEAFVRDDTLFKKSPLDAYGQAWALTFYLAETRSVEFAKYLKTVAGRNPLEKYEPDARVKDFCDTFGRDLDFLESGMIRFYDRLRAG